MISRNNNVGRWLMGWKLYFVISDNNVYPTNRNQQRLLGHSTRAHRATGAIKIKRPSDRTLFCFFSCAPPLPPKVNVGRICFQCFCAPEIKRQFLFDARCSKNILNIELGGWRGERNALWNLLMGWGAFYFDRTGPAPDVPLSEKHILGKGDTRLTTWMLCE